MFEFTPEMAKALREPFAPEEIKQREGRGGMKFAYVDARAVQNRLDDVVGTENWSTTFRVMDPEKWAVECQLRIGMTVKADVGYPNSDRDDEVEPLKAAYSDAFKRAAVQWGVGRHLYEKGPQRTISTGGTGSRLADHAQSLGGQVVERRPAQAPQNGSTDAFRERLGAPPSNGGYAPKGASEKQIGAIRAIARGRKVDEATLTSHMLSLWNTADVESLTSRQASDLIGWLQQQEEM